MIADLNHSNFTKILVVFCLSVFCFAILASSDSTFLEIFRYLIIGGVFIFLFYYYSIFDFKNSDETDEVVKSNNIFGLDKGKSNNNVAKNMYIELQSLINMIVKATNNKFETDIYIIDPDSQILTKQNPNSGDFCENISL